MKRIFFLVLAAGMLMQLTGQTEIADPPAGKVSAKIYSNFNYSLDKGNPSSAFEVQRAYFGYKRSLNENFSAEVKLDIGSIDNDSEFSLIRRYAYFKNAYMAYQAGKVKTWFGLFDMLQFKVQEKFWGSRELYKS